jgi:HK97 gp10 family phage protein
VGDLIMGLKRVSGDPAKAVQVFLDKNLSKETRALRAASLVFVGVIKETLSTPGRGAIRRGGKERVGSGSFNGKLHMVRRGIARTNIDVTDRASLPGDPPAPDTGQLRNSIDYELTSETTAHVGTNSEYAAPLEFGTSRIAPRPFMRPSLAKAGPMMGPVIAEELRGGPSGN